MTLTGVSSREGRECRQGEVRQGRQLPHRTKQLGRRGGGRVQHHPDSGCHALQFTQHGHGCEKGAPLAKRSFR